VSNSRFHFIIPAESTLEDPASLMALVEGKYNGSIPLSTLWEPPAQAEAAGEEDSAYNAEDSVFESKDHLLHGMLHLNGFGHLLRMNGSQGGSKRLIGGCRAVLWCAAGRDGVGAWHACCGVREGQGGGGWDVGCGMRDVYAGTA
jgi:hypothetical protein